MSEQPAFSKLHPEFLTTDWSLVRRMQEDETIARQLATVQWLETYYPALLAHLVLRMRIDRAEAEDLLQGFLAEKVLQPRLLAQADPAKGKLRSLLLKALNNYVVDEVRRRRGEHRSDAASAENTLAAEPDVFDIVWAQRTLAEAFRRMRQECQQRGRTDLWEIFAGRILHPVLFVGVEPLSYAMLVERFGFQSPKQAVNAVITARRYFQRVLREVTAEYVSHENIDSELADLRSVLSQVGNAGLRLPVLDIAGDAAHESDRHDTDPEAFANFFARDDDQPAWRIDELRAVWAHQLRTPLHVELAGQTGSKILQKTSVPRTPPLTTFGDLFQHPCPPLELLESAKQYAKRFLRLQASAPCEELATALYFCCIAAALVRHRARITTLADSILTAGIQMTKNRQWVDEPLKALLNESLLIAERWPIPPTQRG